MQTLKCRLGLHDYQPSSVHPYSKMGLNVRVCQCCRYAQASESDIPWYEIPRADQLEGYQPPPVNRR